jgi:hypothetical protein
LSSDRLANCTSQRRGSASGWGTGSGKNPVDAEPRQSVEIDLRLRLLNHHQQSGQRCNAPCSAQWIVRGAPARKAQPGLRMPASTFPSQLLWNHSVWGRGQDRTGLHSGAAGVLPAIPYSCKREQLSVRDFKAVRLFGLPRPRPTHKIRLPGLATSGVRAHRRTRASCLLFPASH